MVGKVIIADVRLIVFQHPLYEVHRSMEHWIKLSTLSFWLTLKTHPAEPLPQLDFEPFIHSPRIIFSGTRRSGLELFLGAACILQLMHYGS